MRLVPLVSRSPSVVGGVTSAFQGAVGRPGRLMASAGRARLCSRRRGGAARSTRDWWRSRRRRVRRLVGGSLRVLGSAGASFVADRRPGPVDGGIQRDAGSVAARSACQLHSAALRTAEPCARRDRRWCGLGSTGSAERRSSKNVVSSSGACLGETVAAGARATLTHSATTVIVGIRPLSRPPQRRGLVGDAERAFEDRHAYDGPFVGSLRQDG